MRITDEILYALKGESVYFAFKQKFESVANREQTTRDEGKGEGGRERKVSSEGEKRQCYRLVGATNLTRVKWPRWSGAKQLIQS